MPLPHPEEDPGDEDTGLNRSFYLPRLRREFYQGSAVVFWTLSIAHRSTGWLTREFHSHFREIMLHSANRENLLCPAYSLLPDHLHLVWMGLTPESDQRNGMAFLRTHLKRFLTPHRFQHQPHDHVLRARARRRNAFAMVCQYILENPVRASLAENIDAWEFSGSIVPGFPTSRSRKER